MIAATNIKYHTRRRIGTTTNGGGTTTKEAHLGIASPRWRHPTDVSNWTTKPNYNRIRTSTRILLSIQRDLRIETIATLTIALSVVCWYYVIIVVISSQFYWIDTGTQRKHGNGQVGVSNGTQGERGPDLLTEILVRLSHRRERTRPPPPSSHQTVADTWHT